MSNQQFPARDIDFNWRNEAIVSIRKIVVWDVLALCKHVMLLTLLTKELCLLLRIDKRHNY